MLEAVGGGGSCTPHILRSESNDCFEICNTKITTIWLLCNKIISVFHLAMYHLNFFDFPLMAHL